MKVPKGPGMEKLRTSIHGMEVILEKRVEEFLRFSLVLPYQPQLCQLGFIYGNVATHFLEHWVVLKYAANGLKDASRLLARLALGLVPGEMMHVHGRGEIMPSVKLSGGLRPILISSILRRIALKAVAHMSRRAVQEFVGDLQLCFAKDGITKAHHAISCLTRKDRSRCLLSLDTSAAHQSFNRSSADSAIATAAPDLQLP